MNVISNIENRIQAVNEQIGKLEKSLSDEKENFALSIQVKSLISHRDELREQLRYEKEIREKEIIELRLNLVQMLKRKHLKRLLIQLICVYLELEVAQRNFSLPVKTLPIFLGIVY